MDRLDFLVSQLVRRVRKRPPLFGWKSYRAIDHHWHLRLWLTIEGLIGRAACNAPRRPLEDYNERLVSPALGELTKKFFQRYREVLNGWDPSTIKWEMYDKLFSSVTGKFISRRVPLTEAKEAASLVFLNLFCKDQQWTKKHWKGAFHLTQWIMTSLQHPETAAKLRRFLIPTDVCTPMLENIRRLPDYFAEKKKMAKRVKDSDRKRRTK